MSDKIAGYLPGVDSNCPICGRGITAATRELGRTAPGEPMTSQRVIFQPCQPESTHLR